MKRRSARPFASPIAGMLAAAALAGCAANPHRYFQPTADQVGPYPNSYGEAVIPRHGLIVVQGDDFAYGLARNRSRHVINGAAEGQAGDTISQALRKIVKGVKVENRGYPGDTIAVGATRWATAAPGNLLILSYGIGDLHAHTTIAAFNAQLQSTIVAAQAKGATVFVVPSPELADPIGKAAIGAYRANAIAVANAVGAEVFDPYAAMARIKSPPRKTFAQPAAVYQAIAADMIPYIKVVAAPSPQTGQAGSGDNRTVRVSPASAS